MKYILFFQQNLKSLILNVSTFLLFFYEKLNSHYEAWSYKKKKHKKVNAYRKSV